MTQTVADRRSGDERRDRTLFAYLYGGHRPRRLNGRRESDRIYPFIDWHSPRVLALALGILGLCVADGVLTVVLITNGATEENPFMAMLVPHNLGLFAAVKLTLTAVSLFVIVACSRMRLMRRIPGESIMYAVLAAYAVLIGYELNLLAMMPVAW
ncbi:MAG: DUF5658 family protein [Steroidobacteraceae bacterium]